MEAMEYREAVEHLYYCLVGFHPTTFHAQLYQLIQKAGPIDRERLRKAYPIEIHAFEAWETAKTSEEFFQQFGINTNGRIR